MDFAAQLSVKEVARILRVHPQTVYRLSKRADGPPSYWFGGLLMFDSEELKRWMATGGGSGPRPAGHRPQKNQRAVIPADNCGTGAP